MNDAVGYTIGFVADRAHDRGRRFSHQHERIAARQAAEHAELVAADQHELRSDPVGPQLLEHRARGVGLVGEADLHVLRVTGDPRVGEPGVPPHIGRQRGDFRQIANPRFFQPLLDRGEQSIDLRLRRIRPFGKRNQVDLAPIEPLRHDARFEPALREQRDDPLGRGRQGGIFFGVASRRASSRGPSESTSKSSDPRFRASRSRPGPVGRARS